LTDSSAALAVLSLGRFDMADMSSARGIQAAQRAACRLSLPSNNRAQ
jgi:hypothetical protein